MNASSFDDPIASIVKLKAEGRSGTGFVVAIDQELVFVLTAAHVIEGSQKINVEFGADPARSYPGQVYRMDVNADIALLKVPQPKRKVEALPISAQEVPPGGVGEIVGYPNRAPKRRFADVKISGLEDSRLSLTGEADPGSSGSPVLYQGAVVGLVVAVEGNYPEAVPGATLRRVVETWLPADLLLPEPPISPTLSENIVCHLSPEEPNCELGETGARCRVAFFDQPERARITLSGTASKPLPETLFAGGSGTIDFTARSGELYKLDIAFLADEGVVEVIARR